MKQNRLRVLVRTLLVLALTMFGAGTASAQFGKIDGRVKAVDGKPLALARVTIVGQPFTTETNKEGYFFFNNVPAGVYDISVTMLGYGPQRKTDHRVVSDQTQSIDFSLQLQGAQVLAEIATTSTRPLVDRQLSSSRQTLDPDYIDKLPENRIASLLALKPGVSRPLTGDTLRLSVRGGRFNENITYLDGVPQAPLMAYRSATFAPSTSVDANIVNWDINIATNGFEDVTLITGAAGAQFGNALGGIINTTTRSGTSNYRGSVSWETGMIGGAYATGNNSFAAAFSGPLFLKGLTFSANTRLEGTAWTNTGYQGWLFPRSVPVGIDTTFVVPRANSLSNASSPSGSFGNSRSDSVSLNVYKTAVYSGDCDNFFFVRDAALQEMRDNYGVECDRNRTFTSGPRTNYSASGSLQYGYGNGSRIRLSYNWSATQSRPRLLNDGRTTGSLTGATSAALQWSQTLFTKGSRSLNVSATYSLQHNNALSSPITIESEKASRHPFSGFLLKPLDFVYHEKDFPIDSTILKAYINKEAYRVSLVPTTQTNTTVSVGTVGSTFPIDNLTWQSSTGGGGDDVGANFKWQWENRHVAQVRFDAQVDRWNRLTFGADRTKTESKAFGGAASGGGVSSTNSWFRPVQGSAFVEDKLDLSDVVVTAGLRWDYFNYHIKRWVGYPRISSLPTFDPENPDKVMKEDKSHDYLAPRIQVAFPVTQQTNFRLSYTQSVQAPNFNDVTTLHNADITRSTAVTTTSNFGADVGFTKVVAFEFGVQHAFSDDMVFDIAFYNRDNLANLQFKYAKLYDPISKDFRTVDLLQNSDFGNSRGVEVSMDRQIGQYLNGRLNYSYSDVKNTGSSSTDFLNFFELNGAAGDPPAAPLPVAQSTPHTLNGVVTLGLPADFKRGTLLGKILGNTNASATFQLQSGTPYTRCDPALQSSTGQGTFSGSACTQTDAVQGYNQSRLPWTKSLNTQFRKTFQVRKVSLAAFLTVNNILNITNTRRVYATTGSTKNPALFTQLWRTDSTNFVNAAQAHGFLAGTNMVLPTTTAGCAKVTNGTSPLVQSCFYWLRAEQRWGNGDGVYTLDEFRRTSDQTHLKDTHISNFINGFRTMRFGLTVNF